MPTKEHIAHLKSRKEKSRKLRGHSSFTQAGQSDDKTVLMMVKRDGLTLGAASREQKANFAIVLAAVQTNGYALTFASAELKANKKIVIAAINSDVNGERALNLAAAELREDPDVLAAAAGGGVTACGEVQACDGGCALS